MRDATWFFDCATGAGACDGAGASVGGQGATARSAVCPLRVSPVAKAGPPPPSTVESRLMPTTRGGGPLGSGAGTLALGGGAAFFTIGSGFGGSGRFSSGGGEGGGGGGSRTSTRTVCSTFSRRPGSLPPITKPAVTTP